MVLKRTRMESAIGPCAPPEDFGKDMFHRIEELEKRAGIRLSLAHKILLVEIGTVEQMLSIISGGPVEVIVKKQRIQSSGLILRESWLLSKKTGKRLVLAKSRIFVLNLPRQIVSKIMEGKEGIGTILSSSALETSRRITRLGFDSTKGCVYRKYQIICSGKIAFEITEELPFKS